MTNFLLGVIIIVLAFNVYMIRNVIEYMAAIYKIECAIHNNIRGWHH